MLLLVPTPIGNIHDITLRSLEALARADVVLCEDTRVARRLYTLLHKRFSHILPTSDFYTTHSHSRTSYNQTQTQPQAQNNDQTTSLANYHALSLQPESKRFLALHSHNQEKLLASFTPEFFSNTIIYISDAGMPGVCDPGAELVRYCIAHNLAYDVLPGACALITAWAQSGISSQEFVFGGFLAHKKTDKQSQILRLAESNAPIIFYESPHRLLESISIIDSLMPDSTLFAIKELTKRYQYHINGTPKEVRHALESKNTQGEWVLILSPNSSPNANSSQILPQISSPNLLNHTNKHNTSTTSTEIITTDTEISQVDSTHSKSSQAQSCDIQTHNKLVLYESDILAMPLPPKAKAKLLARLSGGDVKSIYQMLIHKD